MESYPFRAMNSSIVLAAEGEPPAVELAFTAARAAIEEYERRFTRFSETSELSQLNRSAGSWYRPSADLYQLVELAYRQYQLTDGLFNPAILSDLKRAGYDRSLEIVQAVGCGNVTPPYNNADGTRTDNSGKGIPPFGRRDFSAVRFDDNLGTLLLPVGLEIDLGGIAKGWIAERTAQVMAKTTLAGAVSAGGDIYMYGIPDGQESWTIELEDPRNPENVLTILDIGPGAVATSSVARRVWRQGDHQRHHLIDPRTGEPADTPWLSVTVIAPEATTAEVFAKALLIAGPDQAMEIASRNQEITFIAVDPQGSMWGSPESLEVIHGNS
jgi:FAD:protein FMN transferase